VDKKDLCVTDNGFAFVVGNSLIVAAKKEEYCTQGGMVEESDYWRWMFRLLCCLRECFMLCDISSRYVHKLRERYESERALCFKDGNKATLQQEKHFEEESRALLDELAQVASLLFTVEEGVHAVAASRVSFVQEKLRTFIDHMGLSDLLENVSKRRQRLEQRLHDEMSRLLQGHMERLAKNGERLAIGAAVLALLTFIYAWKLDDIAGELKAAIIGKGPSQEAADSLSNYSKRAAEALETIAGKKATSDGQMQNAAPSQ
jgi:hypothetical protein